MTPSSIYEKMYSLLFTGTRKSNVFFKLLRVGSSICQVKRAAVEGKQERISDQNGTRARAGEESWFTMQSTLRKLVCTSALSGKR